MRTPTSLLPLALLPALLAGCCHIDRIPKGDLLPPLSRDEQLSRINARAALVDTLKASGTVTLTWYDKDNSRKQVRADGDLQFRKMPPAKPGAPTTYEVVIFGKVASQYAFELGENTTHYWMANYISDPKVATIVDKIATDFFPTFAAAPEIPLRAGTVPLALGVAPVSPGFGTPQQTVVLTNLETVEVITLAGAGLWPISAVELSRYAPGDPVAVRIYRPDGKIEGEAQLSNYQSVTTADPRKPSTQPAPQIRLPFYISIVYPARKAQIDLEVSSYTLNPPMKDIFFDTPELPGFQIDHIRPEAKLDTPH